MTRRRVFQTSLMSALLDGVYDGDLTVAELLQHGDFGLGTFDALDGEMLVLDGVCYRMRSDGSIHPADGQDRTPFAVVTEFVPEVTVALDGQLTRAQVVDRIMELVHSQNYLYAVRIRGRFESVVTRSVARQSTPYQPMKTAVHDEPILEHTNIGGVIVGFRTPLYEQGIGVPGGHVHFIDDARRSGGHVLDFVITEGVMELCTGTDLDLRLPLSDRFRSADLAPADLGSQIEATENQRPS
jgi:acetolactate decarboxylase